jgi:hypothetical protein
MKRILLLSLSLLFIIIACKESVTEPQDPADVINDKYYVLNNGSNLVYTLSITDTNSITVNGFRYFKINDSTLIGATYYKNQIDSFETYLPFDTLTTSVISNIRGTNGGVYTYADTTGLIDFLPDSLRQYLSADVESRLLFYPLTLSQGFPVYTLTLSAFIIGINVIDVDAKVESEEIVNLTVNNIQTQFNSYKIKYNFVVRTSSTNEYLYTAYGWVVKDLGFIKWDGDSEVFNFLFNENIFPPETNVKMDLISYQF